jgi:hypothetical protein
MSPELVPESDRREKERQLLQQVQQAQEEFHASPPEQRAAALEKYLRAVNRFSDFVLDRKPSQ